MSLIHHHGRQPPPRQPPLATNHRRFATSHKRVFGGARHSCLPGVSHPSRQTGMSAPPQWHSLIQQLRAFLEYLQNQLAEQRVGPGEPGAGEAARVVLVEGLVHEAGARVALLQQDEAREFRRRPCWSGAEGDPQRPNHISPHVRPAGSFAGLPLREIGVPLGENQPPGRLVDGIAERDPAKIGQREQIWGVRVVDAVVVAESVRPRTHRPCRPSDAAPRRAAAGPFRLRRPSRGIPRRSWRCGGSLRPSWPRVAKRQRRRSSTEPGRGTPCRRRSGGTSSESARRGESAGRSRPRPPCLRPRCRFARNWYGPGPCLRRCSRKVFKTSEIASRHD